MFGKLAYYDLKRHFEYSFSAGVRNPFVLYDYDVSSFSLLSLQPSFLLFRFISVTPPGWLGGQLTAP